MNEFNYQWKNLVCDDIQYNKERINEFLSFTKIKLEKNIQNKNCLDAGCGSGRYTYAMQQLGAKNVTSFDQSPEAINKCKEINPNAFVQNIMDLFPKPFYDFVLCWGVLHHMKDPRKGFSKISSQVKKENGILHVMLYHKKTQQIYQEGRKIWKDLSLEQKIDYCSNKIKEHGGTIHGWFDAFNPQFNWSYDEKEIKTWFKDEGFEKINIVTKYNININGRYCE